MHKIQILGVRLLSLVAIFLVGGSSVFAAPNGGVGGRPANPDPDNPRSQSIFIYTLDRGESKQDQVLIVNNGDTERTVSVNAVDGVVANTGSFTCKQETENQTDLGKWIKLSKQQLVLQPNENITVDFTVAMPKDADVGEHNGCIAFMDAKQTASVKNGVAIETRSAIRVVATVPGDLTRSVDITHFSVDKVGGKQSMVLSMKNTGNVSADTNTHVALKDLFGKTVYENGGSYPVISNQKLDLNFEITKPPFWGGWYTASADIAYDKRAGTFGTADAAQLTRKNASSFLVFVMPSPAALIIYLGILLVLIALLAWLLNRSRKAKKVRTSWAQYTVREGDTIGSIAKRCGMGWKELARANKIKAPYTLRPGQHIKVPRPRR